LFQSTAGFFNSILDTIEPLQVLSFVFPNHRLSPNLFPQVDEIRLAVRESIGSDAILPRATAASVIETVHHEEAQLKEDHPIPPPVPQTQPPQLPAMPPPSVPLPPRPTRPPPSSLVEVEESDPVPPYAPPPPPIPSSNPFDS
jgi:hypothetical protein